MTRSLLFENSKSKISLVDSITYHDVLSNEIPEQIVMKVLKNNTPTPDEIQQFYNEYEILKDISHPNIRKVYLKTKYQNRHTIFLEWIDGKPLKTLGKMKLDQFLTLATQITSALMKVHEHHIVHNDVNASNILVDSTSKEVKLIDFGIASRTERINHSFEGTIPYASPEQLGHPIKTIVDHRSDLYSLGVVFYFMLTGKLPFGFSSTERLKEIHLNDYATPVHELNPTIPRPVSDLIKKLTKKNAEDRYQSACGLLHDLRNMLALVESKDGRGGTIASDFIIGQKDFSGRLQISNKIYGRVKETATMSCAFDRVVEIGTFEVCMIAGAAGTGKSSLANNLHEQVVQQKGGYFVRGKFDQLQKDEPYSAILRAFDGFFGSVMAREDSASIEMLRCSVQDALGAEGKILTNTMSQLRYIIGDQPDIPDIDSIEIKNRWRNLFLKLINAIASKKRPILLFIDDLQWADDESLSLLSALVADKNVKYLLLVGAYRHDEITNTNNLLSQIMDKKKNNVIVHMIEIGNLSNSDTAKLVYSFLDAACENASSFANLVYLKTHGNAFFITQFMKSLINDQLLYFSYSDLKWKCDMQKTTAKNVTENVADFLLESMTKYSNEMKHILKIASCIGSCFSLSMLRLLVEDDYLPMTIEKAAFEGIITAASPENDTFCFSHDQIHQAAYSLVLESGCKSTHLNIGRGLKKKLSANELDEMLFVVVNQFNSGLDMIDDKCEQIDVAILNLRAAKKARFSSAFKKAAMYVNFGINLLSKDHWIEQYDLSLELYTVAIEMKYCNSEFDHMANLMEGLFSNTRTMLDATDSFLVKINYLLGQKKFDEALEVGLHVLTELGEALPINPSMISTMYNIIKTKMMLWTRGSDAIVSMHSVRNKTEKSKVQLLSTILLPANINDGFLKVQMVLRWVQITLSHGVSEFSAIAFAMYGMLVAIVQDANEGYRFGQVALQLLNRFPNKKCHVTTYPIVFGGINHRKEYIHDIIPHMRQSAQIAQDIGDFGMSVYSLYILCTYSFLSGRSLKEVDNDFNICYENAHTYKQEHVIIMLKPIWQATRNLMDSKSLKKKDLFGDIFTECDVQEYSKESITFAYYTANIMYTYIFYYYDEAAQIVYDGKDKFPFVPWYGVTAITFYSGLIALLKAREDQNNKNWINIATNSIQRMEMLTKNCPDNHQHKIQLLLAERAVMEGDDQQAIEHFDKAINYAERKGFMNIEALASERAFLFCFGSCDLISAQIYYTRACQVYREWGAHAKVSQIENLYGSQMSAFKQVTFKRKFEG